MGLQNLFGDLGLESSLQKIAHHMQVIAGNIGKMYPDTSGNMRVAVQNGTVTTVTTVGTVSNVGAVGGYNAQYDQYSQMQSNANGNRSRITVS